MLHYNMQLAVPEQYIGRGVSLLPYSKMINHKHVTRAQCYFCSAGDA